MRILRCGTRAVLVELEDLDQVLSLHAALRRDPLPGTVDLVPAARTLLVPFDPRATTFDALTRALERQPLDLPSDRTPDTVDLPVRYDGEDLSEVAAVTGLTEAEVVERHRDGQHTVAFCGFAPGFAYVAGLDERLGVPRRATPRTRVPAGAVAIADRFTGIYPRESPGGWRIIGHTDAPLWDLERDPPALLTPGIRVRFVEARP